MWSSASSNELRMSLPITAVGPLKVETNPILMVSAATAGFASARTVAPASQNAVLIVTPPRHYLKYAAANRPARFGEPSLPLFSVFEPLRLMASFVREILGLRQARPSVSLNIEGWLAKIMHHNSYRARIARIIVLVIRRASQCPAGRNMPTGRLGRPADQIRYSAPSMT